MPVRASQPTEREAMVALARRAGVFDDEEVATVGELFDGYVDDPQVSGYNFLSYYGDDGEVLGFACWGPASLSKGAADLYWICTAPEAQGRGVGAALFREVEAAVRALGRWLVVIWTSSRHDYGPARRFYERMGCSLSMQLADFYDHGDDLVVYAKRVD